MERLHPHPSLSRKAGEGKKKKRIWCCLDRKDSLAHSNGRGLG